MCKLASYLGRVQQLLVAPADASEVLRREKALARYIPRDPYGIVLVNHTHAHLLQVYPNEAWAHQTTILLCVSANEKPV